MKIINMSFVFKSFKFLILVLTITLSACKAQYPELEDGLYAEFVTNKGVMVAKLAYDKTPVTVANFVSLAEGENTLVDEKYLDKPFYNGLKFHRVINDFMIQGGDPNGDGSGNPGYRFNDEFDPSLKHTKKGILAMANSGQNSNGSQFYITHKATPWLDAYDDNNILKNCSGRRVSCHTVFGEIVLGLEVIDSIEKNDIIEQLNIIRKGRSVKSFDAPKVFKAHFAQVEHEEKVKAEKEAAIIKACKERFEKQQSQAITLPSGLQYIITEKGSGEALTSNSKVLTHYSVYYEDGKLIDTSKLETAEANGALNEQRKLANGYQPLEADISPNARMIAGFKEGLQQLQVGDKATLFIPYHLAYGETGNRGIKPKSNLIFEVEILELLK